jgi:hypothetical protein
MDDDETRRKRSVPLSRWWIGPCLDPFEPFIEEAAPRRKMLKPFWRARAG